MRVLTAALFTVLVALHFCKGAQPSWDRLKKAEPHTWKCLASGDICSSATEPLTCCPGHCCSNGNCSDQPCGETSSAGQPSSPTAELRNNRLTDFSGRQFEFPSTQGESFSLITEADHQVNALLQPSNGQPQELGITLRGVGIHGPDTSIRISAAYDGKLAVEVNDRPFRGTQMRLDGVTITAGCEQPECSSLAADSGAVTVADSFMMLWAWPEQAPTQASSSLNLKVAVTGRPMSQVHGILGQTLDRHGSFVSAAPATRVALPTNLQWYGEGQPGDYSTTDLFSSDSTFSVFTRKTERRRRHRRKRQILEGATLASLAHASREAGRAKQETRHSRPR